MNIPMTAKRYITKSQRSNESCDWGLKLLNVPSLWKQSMGEGIKVAVLDTGVAASHPDLKDAIVSYRDFTGEGTIDPVGHGTHVSGIIGARANKIGIIGIAPKCELIVGKVLGKRGGIPSWILSGMKWAIEQGADIISMSFGAPEKIRGLDVIIQRNKHVYYAAAIGNNGILNNVNEYPACYSDVIAVGSIDKMKMISQFSSKSQYVDVVAPGSNIYSTYPPSRYMRMSGTSMATPFVSGVMALCLSKHKITKSNTPITNRQEMLQHLAKYAIDLGPKGKDTMYGYGLINPAESLS